MEIYIMAITSKNSSKNISALVTYWQASEHSARPPKNRNELLDNARKIEPAFKCSTYDLLNATKEIKERIRQNALISLPRTDIQGTSESLPSDSISPQSGRLYSSLMELCNCFELEAINQAKEQGRSLIANELSKISLALDAIKVQNADLQEKLAKALILLNQNGVNFEAKDFEITSIEGAISDIRDAFLQPDTSASNSAINLKPINLSELFTASFDDYLNSNHVGISLCDLSDNVTELNQLIANMATASLSNSKQSNEAAGDDNKATPAALDDNATSKQGAIKKPCKRTTKAKKQAPSKDATKATDNADNEPLNDADKPALPPQAMEWAGDNMEPTKKPSSNKPAIEKEPAKKHAKTSINSKRSIKVKQATNEAIKEASNKATNEQTNKARTNSKKSSKASIKGKSKATNELTDLSTLVVMDVIDN